MRTFKATYQDKNGVEETVVKSNGSDLSLTLRGMDFEGTDFEMLSGKIDPNKFDYELFADGSGDLTNFKIELEIPILLFDATKKTTFRAPLAIIIEVGEKILTKGLDSEIHSLKLTTPFGIFENTKKLEWMETALISLQNQLPKNIYLKTCLSCKYSNYNPYGNGMFGSIYCFKNAKEALKKLKNKHDLLNLWTAAFMTQSKAFSVQETFDCDEHQLPTKNDWYYKDWNKFID